MPTPIEIEVGSIALEAELDDTETARAIADALPFDLPFNTWGDEFYFTVPVRKKLDATATLDVDVGTLAYWPGGTALAIFFGKTPASIDERPRPIDEVNLVGRITGDATKLKAVMSASRIVVRKR